MEPKTHSRVTRTQATDRNPTRAITLQLYSAAPRGHVYSQLSRINCTYYDVAKALACHSRFVTLLIDFCPVDTLKRLYRYLKTCRQKCPKTVLCVKIALMKSSGMYSSIQLSSVLCKERLKVHICSNLKPFVLKIYVGKSKKH